MKCESCFKCIFFHYDEYTEEYDCYLEMFGTAEEYEVWKSRSKAFWDYDRQRAGKDDIATTCKEYPCNLRIGLGEVYELKKKEITS